MCYTLQECLERTGSLRRGKYVYRVLCENGIRTWDDFVAKPIPSKGLYNNEVLALNRIRMKELDIREAKASAYNDLVSLLSKYVRKNDARRIASSLKREDIWSMRLLASTPDEKLEKIYGIGPKSLDILKKVKTFLNSPKAMTSGKSKAVSAAPSPFQPLLAY